MQVSKEWQTFSPVCQGKLQACFSILARALEIYHASLYSCHILRSRPSEVEHTQIIMISVRSVYIPSQLIRLKWCKLFYVKLFLP